METPPRKRLSSATPSSTSHRNVKKRSRIDPLASPRSKNVRFQAISYENYTDAFMESLVPASLIAESQGNLSMSFAPPCAQNGIFTDPFMNLSLKESLEKKTLLLLLQSQLSTESSRPRKVHGRHPEVRELLNQCHSRSRLAICSLLIQSSTTSLIHHPLAVTPIAVFPWYFMSIPWLVGYMLCVFSVRTPIIPGEGMFIVAKVEGEKNMAVIERIKEHVYSMCALKKESTSRI
jgi:hypothetical protein